MFKFNYTLSDNDYFEYNVFHAFNSPFGKKNALIARFLFPVLFIMIGLILGFLMTDDIATWCFPILFGLVAVYWLIFFKRFMTKQIKKNMNRVKKTGKLPYHKEITISFEDDLIIQTTQNGEAKTKYSAIERIAISKNAIYIYINAVQAILIPFTVFPDNKSLEEFLIFFKEKRSELRNQISVEEQESY